VLFAPLSALLVHARGATRDSAVSHLGALLRAPVACQAAVDAGVVDAAQRLLQDSAAATRGAFFSLRHDCLFSTVSPG
jgi:hypothetical protein